MTSEKDRIEQLEKAVIAANKCLDWCKRQHQTGDEARFSHNMLEYHYGNIATVRKALELCPKEKIDIGEFL